MFLPIALFAQAVAHVKKSPVEEINPETSQIMLLGQMDQRKIYHYGQRSTPTGREAGEPSITYVKVVGDSAIVLKDPPGAMNDSRHLTARINRRD